MKSLSLILTYFLLCFQVLLAQKYSTNFGEITSAEIDLKVYEDDKDAEAVVLFDIGRSYFVRRENSFDVAFERMTRIKILSDAGIKWSEVEIPFYQEGGIYERVFDIEAYTYNFEDGRMNKTELDVSNIYDEKINDYWNIRKFVLPNVNTGSIIEYKYKINSQYKFNLRDWEFQWRIPVIYSKYVTEMIPFYEYSYLLQGASGFDYHKSYVDSGVDRQFGPINYNDMVYEFAMKNVPAFNDEQFITSINDYIIKLDFQLSRINNTNGNSVEIMTSWDRFIQDLSRHMDFGKYIKKSKKSSSDLFDSELLAGKTEQEKFNYIINVIKHNFTWNGMNAKYASKSPKKFVAEKEGNSADINLFAIGVLNEFNIEAFPVVISTRDHGKIKYDYPYSHFFNYVIILAEVDGKKVLTDATDSYILNERLPVKCINDRGLIVNKSAVEWVLLNSTIPTETINEYVLNVNEEKLEIELSTTAFEYDALKYRKNYLDNTEKLKELLDSDQYEILENSINVQNYSDLNKPYILSYNLIQKPNLINNKLYISPFLNEPISDNPLKQKNRKYPLDMIYPQKRIFRSVIYIPANYEIDFLPEIETINNDLFTLNYNLKKNDATLEINLEYFFKESVYDANNYSKLKYYFDRIIKKGNEKIVLVKKNT